MNYSLCVLCYFNSKNDFFEPDLVRGKLVKVCALVAANYPHARECIKYEPANRDPEAAE